MVQCPTSVNVGISCTVPAVNGEAGVRQVERLYLDRLMQTRGANEGLAAFIAKRPPKWEHL